MTENNDLEATVSEEKHVPGVTTNNAFIDVKEFHNETEVRKSLEQKFGKNVIDIFVVQLPINIEKF